MLVSEMTYNVSMGTLNPTIPYHTNANAQRRGKRGQQGHNLLRWGNAPQLWSGLNVAYIHITKFLESFHQQHTDVRMHQIRFAPAGAPLRNPLESSRRSPEPLVE